MVRPAAVGSGSSLDAVKKEVTPVTLADMREFAREVSPSVYNDLIAVVHIAIYMIDTGKPELVSSGAVCGSTSQSRISPRASRGCKT